MDDTPAAPSATPAWKKILWVMLILDVVAIISVVALLSVRKQRNTAPSVTDIFPTQPLAPTPPLIQTDTPAQTPSPVAGPGNYVCDSLGYCNIADEQGKIGCPITYADSRCLDACKDPANRCPFK